MPTATSLGEAVAVGTAAVASKVELMSAGAGFPSVVDPEYVPCCACPLQEIISSNRQDRKVVRNALQRKRGGLKSESSNNESDSIEHGDCKGLATKVWGGKELLACNSLWMGDGLDQLTERV